MLLLLPFGTFCLFAKKEGSGNQDEINAAVPGKPIVTHARNVAAAVEQ